MRKHIKLFENFEIEETQPEEFQRDEYETGEYEPDQDNISDIMKDEYGYGDLSGEWFEEFENSKQYKNIKSDEEYAQKFDIYIDKFGKNN